MRKQPRREGWYRRTSLPHFDLPIGFELAERLVKDAEYVCRHSYWPLIGYDETKRRFRTIDGKRTVDVKTRPIKYCSHLDGHIHAYYTVLASAAYEMYVNGKPWERSVIGYRAGLGSNIDMAGRVFREIQSRNESDVICLDISSFFDNIDHGTLKLNLQLVLEVTRLPDDWFAVFKANTKYSWIDREALAQRLSFHPRVPPRPMCDAETFRRKVRSSGAEQTNLVQRNTGGFGIPQGSPISAVFSNIHMIGFDEAVHGFAKRYSSFYMRYSDDIVIVCRPRDRELMMEVVRRELARLGGTLEIAEEKTEVSRFVRISNGLQCDAPVTYLGVKYDGARFALRDRTLSRYYRAMSYAARRTARAAQRAGSPIVFKRKLLRDFSHSGRDNFYAYAKRASEVLGDEGPKRQLRRHMKILERKVTNRGR